MTHIAIDLETTAKKIFKRVANPFFNQIVAVGLKTKDELLSRYVYPDNLEDLKLDGIDVLVGHNIKFDLLYLWKMKSVQDFFLRGGRIWDTQYAEYTLSMQQEKYPALRDLAPKYGCAERPKHIENLLFAKAEYWAYANHLYPELTKDIVDTYQDVSDLPKELVLKDVENDVSDTEVIYLKQVERAKLLQMYDMLELTMDAILATTEMEFNGMQINKRKLEENKLKLEVNLQAEYDKLSQFVMKYWE